jgi:CRISPR-associated endonuclease/helicase Cas3
MQSTAMFWGKYDPLVVPSAHPLTDHCLDVAITFLQLAQLPQLGRALRQTGCRLSDLDVHLSRLAVTAFLHDIGKCNWGFQAKKDPQARSTAGHVLEAAAFLWNDRVHARWPRAWQELLEEMSGWFEREDEALCEMLLAAISHHGRPVSENDYHAWTDRSPERWWQPHEGVHPMRGIEELSSAVRRWFPVAFSGSAVRMRATPALQQRFAGLVMLADWIGSDTQFFPYRQSAEEDRLTFAQAAAARALRAIGLEVPSARHVAGFFETFGFPPSPLQALLAESLASADSSRLLLVESDTGSGKTEAALAWFLRLYTKHQVDGLYFALPTRVAARELYGRVCKTMEQAFPDATDRPGPVLLAAPGYVQVDGLSAELVEPEGRIWEDDEKARRRERLWAAERPKRFLAAPVAVGTLDQALLSTLKVKHSLLRSVCLDRHLLVVDEVHASETYMREVLQAVLQGHLARGGWAILLSATLGDAARASYFRMPPVPLQAAVSRPYPAVTTREAEISVARRSRRKGVSVTFQESLEDAVLLPQLSRALAANARVLVVCNTVGRANALLRAVQTRDDIDPGWLFQINGVTAPHHGRFASEDREVMDAQVSALLGKKSASGPLLLIGTQTLEQSLDIDADWLVTDLCPMDVLLQRIGRLHRHERPSRPGTFENAQVLLRVPADVDLSGCIRPDGRCAGPRGSGIGSVYADARILQRTLDVLRRQPSMVIPDDNRRLVELTTHPEALALLESDLWKVHGQWIDGILLARVREALASSLEDKPFGQLHYRAPDERITTRLGADDWSLPFAQPVVSPFGQMVARLVIPSHLKPSGAAAPENLRAELMADGFSFAIGERRYHYTRFGLEIDDAQPPG